MIEIPEDLNLRIPGPTRLAPEVRQALALPMIGHRSHAFSDLHQAVTRGLKEMLRTANDTFILSSSGTGALEAAIVNTISPGDKVLSISAGYFGDRFRSIAQAYHAELVPLDYEWGKAADPDEIHQTVLGHPDLKAVLLTHNETSTGVTHPLQEIAGIVKARGSSSPLLLVDAISSAGAIPLEVDAWQIDSLITGSQKGWMIPPGLAFITFSKAAWEAYEQSTTPRFYFDLGAYKKVLPSGFSPWTPGINLFYALATALELMRHEGLENVWARHQRIAAYTRSRVQEIGLQLLAEPQYASNTVTAVRTPAGLDIPELQRKLEEAYRIVLAGGQGPLKGKIFRIGHLGYVNQTDIDAALSAISQEIPQMIH